MAITKKNTATVANKNEREVLGYWNPKHLVLKDGSEADFKSQYGVTLYADDPLHKVIFEAGMSGKAIHLIGLVNSAEKKSVSTDISIDMI